MSQKFTVLVDLDGTIVDTAPDLMNAHNHVMRKFGYATKSGDEIKSSILRTLDGSETTSKDRLY